MTASELRTQIEKKKAHASWQFEGERDEPLSVHELAELERLHSIRFPSAFVEFLSEYGAGEFAFGRIYSPDEKSGWNLWREFEFMPHLSGQIVPFSDNGGGDYYCFRVVNGSCSDSVLWADHENGYEIVESEIEDFRDFVAKICLRIQK